jgi:hypothetical protein
VRTKPTQYQPFNCFADFTQSGPPLDSGIIPSFSRSDSPVPSGAPDASGVWQAKMSAAVILLATASSPKNRQWLFFTGTCPAFFSKLMAMEMVR